MRAMPPNNEPGERVGVSPLDSIIQHSIAHHRSLVNFIGERNANARELVLWQIDNCPICRKHARAILYVSGCASTRPSYKEL